MKIIGDAQFRSIVEDYHRLLPNWLVVNNRTLVRVDGPVLPAIDWQMTSGHGKFMDRYRPISYIQVLPAPERASNWGAVHFFGGPPRGRPGPLSLAGHAKLCGQMFDTMKVEFRPSILEPLNASAV